MQIAGIKLTAPVVLAPMAGVADAPFRRICRDWGFGLTVGEMVASREELRQTELSGRRFQTDADDPCPVVQLLGSDPGAMADAAVYAVSCGARMVDINFGCPARVVLGKACGSAIMQDEVLAEAIMRRVVDAVPVPVTVKMRTGWDREHRNAVSLARRAQEVGAAAVTVHGRTREDRFAGHAEYETIADVVRALSIPVIANGDITNGKEALFVKEKTGASAVMIGRAAVGNPWVGVEVARMLAGQPPETVPREKMVETVLSHFDRHVAYWGKDLSGLRSFRKHARRYLERLQVDAAVMEFVMNCTDVAQTRAMLADV